MNSVNNTLNLNRLALTMRKDFGESRQKLLLYTGVIFCIALLIGVFHAYDFFTRIKILCENGYYDITAIQQLKFENLSFYSDYHQTMLVMSGFFLLGVCSIAASKAFSQAGSKQAMLRCLATPASQTEKFISAWLIYVPGVIVFTFLSWIVAQYLIYFYIATTTPYGIFFKPQYFYLIFNQSGVGAFTLVVLMFQSFFFLGSAVWPKNAATKTLVSGVVIVGLASTIMTLSMKNFVGHIADINLDIPCAKEIPYVIITAIIALNYTLAYMRYREWEITNKW